MHKIAFVSNSSFSMYFFRKGLISHLVSIGYEVHVIAPEDYKTAGLKQLGCIYHALNFQTKNTNPLRDVMLLYKLYKLYVLIKPDIIFHYTIKPNIYGTMAAWLSRINSVAVITGLGYAFLTNNWINKLVQKMYWLSLGFSSSVWFLNTDDKELFIQRSIIKESKALLLPGEGVNTSEFAPVLNNTRREGFTFLLIARILWDKGVGEYVAAAEKVKEIFPDARFQLLGAMDADNPSAVPKAIVEEWHRKGSIEYLGLSTDVRREMTSADCIVLPSYREGISKVLMEAASMGIPLIATDVTGCKELIDEGVNGYLCEVKDVGSLSEKMQKMIALDKTKLSGMGSAGRQKMLDYFDENKIIKFYIDYMLKIKK